MKIEDETTNNDAYWKLMDEFPILFRDRNLPMSQTCMCFGIESGPGWYQPLYRLCCKLESLNEFLFKQHGFVVKADQVKEKYGTLHFYWSFDKINPINDEFEEKWNDLKYVHLREVFRDVVQKIIDEAEDDCFCTCENCGTPIGNPWHPRYETIGWVSYICEDCLKKLQEKNPMTSAIKHYTDDELKRCEKYMDSEKYSKLLEELKSQKRNLP